VAEVGLLEALKGICPETQRPQELDVQALREKYRYERDKRVRSEGQQQYVTHEEGEADLYETDPYMPVEPRDPISEDLDVVVLGGGWSGVLAGHHLRMAGIDKFRIIDWAGDFGGVWYWNRYPGVQCDNEGYVYMGLLEETGFMPSQRYSDGWEIQAHLQRIGKHYRLYDGALFHTLVETLRWDQGLSRWRIGTNRGDDLRTRFVIMAGGPLNRPKLPAVPGRSSFKGHAFHTARWDYAYTGGERVKGVMDKLADKRVAIVGTGATAVQVVPYLAEHAKHLYVVQRTPSSVAERYNPPTDPEWVKSLSPGWQRRRQDNYHHFAIGGFARHEPDVICDFWGEMVRNAQRRLEAQGWPEPHLEHYAKAREFEDLALMERVRRRIDETVKDKATAEALKPWYYNGCKRPCASNDYLPTFNRPNVTLLDVSGTRGLEAMTETGIVALGKEYEVDCVIFASGFEVTSELSRRWGIDMIAGRDGVSLYDHWRHGYKTLHGMMTHGFPNQFFVGFYQGGFSATTTRTFGQQGHHIAYIIRQALDRGATEVEPTPEAQAAWCQHIKETGVDIAAFQATCTPSYINNEGEKEFRFYIGETYGPGFDVFDQMMADWRAAGDLQGLSLTRKHATAEQPA
jgi:cyclohexanone monooxygenase